MSVISVIGAGPVGLHCAALLREEGFDVSVFEEHSVVGKPVQCAGLISKTGAQSLGLKLSDCIVNEIRGAKIFSPGEECIAVERKETTAFVIDRFRFDQLFYKKAKQAGCDIHLGSKLIDLRSNNLFLESSGHGEMQKSMIIVGADGPNSIVRNSVFGQGFEKNFVQGYQIRAEGSFDKNFVELHFGEFAPGFFAWVIPESGSVARIGLGVRLGENPKECFAKFVQQKNLQVKKLSETAGLIPVAPPAKQLVAGNVLLVGDAAFQTKASTGGGLIFGLQAAQICAATIENKLKHQQTLKVYEKNLKELNKELAIHWKIYSFIQSMQPKQMDELFRKAKSAGIERFLSDYGDMDKPSTFLRKILFKPSMWSLLPAAMKMI